MPPPPIELLSTQTSSGSQRSQFDGRASSADAEVEAKNAVMALTQKDIIDRLDARLTTAKADRGGLKAFIETTKAMVGKSFADLGAFRLLHRES